MVQPQKCKEGAVKLTQTQSWGGWTFEDCHVQKIKLGLGAPDAFRKRRASVTEPYLRATNRYLKMLQKMS